MTEQEKIEYYADKIILRFEDFQRQAMAWISLNSLFEDGTAWNQYRNIVFTFLVNSGLVTIDSKWIMLTAKGIQYLDQL